MQLVTLFFSSLSLSLSIPNPLYLRWVGYECQRVDTLFLLLLVWPGVAWNRTGRAHGAYQPSPFCYYPPFIHLKPVPYVSSLVCPFIIIISNFFFFAQRDWRETTMMCFSPCSFFLFCYCLSFIEMCGQVWLCCILRSDMGKDEKEMGAYWKNSRWKNKSSR